MYKKRAGLTFEVDCPPLPEPVYLDRGMWEKVVLNLLSNALKFTFDGGIRVTTAVEDDHAVVTVADTGVGVPPAEIPRLFERFHRVEGTQRRTHEGSGIGLALVQELVKLHGGSIDVESVLGFGTTFRVHLPLTAAGAVAPVAQLAPNSVRGGRETILVAEDHDGLREIARETLTRLATPRRRIVSRCSGV